MIKSASVNLSQIRENTEIADYMGHFKHHQTEWQYDQAVERECNMVRTEVDGLLDDEVVYEGWCGEFNDTSSQPEDPLWPSKS